MKCDIFSVMRQTILAKLIQTSVWMWETDWCCNIPGIIPYMTVWWLFWKIPEKNYYLKNRKLNAFLCDRNKEQFNQSIHWCLNWIETMISIFAMNHFLYFYFNMLRIQFPVSDWWLVVESYARYAKHSNTLSSNANHGHKSTRHKNWMNLKMFIEATNWIVGDGSILQQNKKYNKRKKENRFSTDCEHIKNHCLLRCALNCSVQIIVNRN